MPLNEITTALYKARLRREKALVPFLDACTLEGEALALLPREIEFAGADIIGLSFTSRSGKAWVDKDVNGSALAWREEMDHFFRAAEMVRRRIEVPLLACFEPSPNIAADANELSLRARDCGIDGLMLPGLEGEAEGHARSIAEARGVVFLRSINAWEGCEAICRAASEGRGFIYIDSSPPGGSQARGDFRLNSAVEGLKRCTDAYLIVGFREAIFPQAIRAAAKADGLALFEDPGSNSRGILSAASVNEAGRLVALYKNHLSKN